MHPTWRTLGHLVVAVVRPAMPDNSTRTSTHSSACWRTDMRTTNRWVGTPTAAATYSVARFGKRALSALALAIVGAGSAFAQVVVQPTFTVAQPSVRIDVTATYAGIFFAGDGFGAKLAVRRTPFVGSPDAPIIVHGGSAAIDPAIAADPTGGFTAAWRDVFEVWARFLDPRGIPSGAPFRLSNGMGIGSTKLASVASGPVIVWAEIPPSEEMVLRAQIGPQRYVLGERPLEFDAATTPSGGCVIVWRTNAGTQAQLFDASGLPIGVPLALAVSDFAVTGLATDPTSGALALAGVSDTATTDVYEIRVFRFGADGAALGPEIVVDTALAIDGFVIGIAPTVAFDFGGDLYVAWGDQAPSTTGVRARAFRSDGTPFGPSITLASQAPSSRLQTAVLPSGEFVNTWIAGQTAHANVVSLCAPGTAMCGDGVVAGGCERCDDGAANDDQTADACRTDCLPAHCGDGVVDAGEQCDDGNFDTCDGCSAHCQDELPTVCGDGLVATACGEQCDDGNASTLDGCTPACGLERIPGGGTPATDCLTAWVIDNPTTVPPYDKHGDVSAKQSCIDDDPRCDFDAGTPGSCTFHVRVCGNNTAQPSCEVPTRLSAWSVTRPSANQAAKHPWLASIRNALAIAPGTIVGPSDQDNCTGEIALTVPLRGEPGRYKAQRTKLQTRAESYDDRKDQDKLSVECRPAN